MGKFDSSLYRVRPLMEQIEKDENAFAALLSLVKIAPLGAPYDYQYDGANCKEKQLKPTKKHLLALIDHMAEKDHGKAVACGKDRGELFYGEKSVREAARLRARALLEAQYDTLSSACRRWYVFEGFTHPDIFIEGENYVIVGEGKWTEPHITTTTAHLCAAGEYRNQMVRHIQGALQHANKKVYAFYIVDENCTYKGALTKAAFGAQLEQETIRLDDDEKKQIADAYCGFTTWQDIQTLLPQIAFVDKAGITQHDR